MRKKIQDGTLGLPPSAPLEGRKRFALFLAGPQHLCLDSMAFAIIQQKTTYKGSKIANYGISKGRRVVENVLGILASRF